MPTLTSRVSSDNQYKLRTCGENNSGGNHCPCRPMYLFFMTGGGEVGESHTPTHPGGTTPWGGGRSWEPTFWVTILVPKYFWLGTENRGKSPPRVGGLTQSNREVRGTHPPYPSSPRDPTFQNPSAGQINAHCRAELGEKF